MLSYTKFQLEFNIMKNIKKDTFNKHKDVTRCFRILDKLNEKMFQT